MRQMMMNKTLGDGNITLDKVMTPIVYDADYDPNSLKRSEIKKKYRH
jgi:hypothetical protein